MTASLFAGYFSVFSTRIGYVLPRKLLPVESCVRLNKDTLIFACLLSYEESLFFFAMSLLNLERIILYSKEDYPLRHIGR